MISNNRRAFLKKGMFGITAAALMPQISASGSLYSDPRSSNLPERTLGKTGIKIPVLSMGTGDTNNPSLVKKALESGVRLLGTSVYYGNGNNESMLGGLLKDFPRESYMIATSSIPKGTDHQNGLFTDSAAGEDFRRDIEAGMKRLHVDYLDILFLPFAAKRESVFFEPLLRVMEDFKKSGKARYVAIATHSYIDEAIKAAADTGIYDMIMTAYNFRMQKPTEVEEAIGYAAEKGLGMIAMKSMAGGFWDRERKEPINSKSALKWTLQNPNIHTIMSGMTTFDELQSNLAMVNEPLTDEDLKELKLADSGKNGMYCLQCRQCEGQCAHNLDIPTLMRSYMYAYGYRNMHHARQTLEMVQNSDKCANCSSCKVVCSAGFDVKQKIRDIERLRIVPEEFLA